MVDQVESKLRELKKQQREEYYRKKNADLAAWGLAARKDGNRRAPMVVTDEEYDALVDASNGVGMPTRNGFAKALNFVGVVLIALGIIVGFLLAVMVAESLPYVWFIASVAVGAVLGVLFFGVAEAIRLLQQISDTQRTANARRVSEQRKAFPEEQPDVTERFMQPQDDDRTAANLM